MKLSEYLKKIRDCPDEKLGNFGIHDNFPLCLSADITQHLLSSRKFSYMQVKGYEKLVWNERTIAITHRNSLQSITYALFQNEPNFTDLENHWKFQKAHFKETLFIHPYQQKKIKGVSDHRAEAIVLEFIANTADSNNISLCLPEATKCANIIGTNRVDYRVYPHYPRYIVYSDNLDEEFRRLHDLKHKGVTK